VAHRQARTSGRLLLLAGGVAVYAWIAAALRPFSQPEYVMVALPIVPVVLLTARPLQAEPGPELAGAERRWRRAAVLWITALVVLASWELLALFSSPRDDHPTLSYLADRIMSTHVGRSIIFLAWLLLGAALAVRPSRPVQR
jgi:hypothetical protein